MDITKMEKARGKVGGYFKLTVLIEKRIRELIKSGVIKEKGLAGSDSLINKILDEILEGQIYIAAEGEPRPKGREEQGETKK